MLRGKDRRLVELKAVQEFWRSFTRQHPELEDRVFRRSRGTICMVRLARR
jgi:hypothetical protein